MPVYRKWEGSNIMATYFIISTKFDSQKDRKPYDEYIQKVKPIVESFGGKYLARSEKITALSNLWKPDRVIIIEFDSRKQIEHWLSSKEYKSIEDLRVNSVTSNALIVESQN